MKKLLSVFGVLFGMALTCNVIAQAKPSPESWAGKWDLLIENLPQGEPRMIISLERKNGKFEGSVMDSSLKEIAKFSKVDETEKNITVYFTAQGYDVNMELERKSEDSVAGNLMGMFPVTGVRYKAGSSSRILVFSKTKGFRHESIEPGNKAFERLGSEHKLQVEFTEDASRFNASDLRDYQAIVFLNTTGDVLDNAQQSAFENYIRGGGGYLGIHAAADCEYDWPWYGKLVGAWFLDHPSSPSNVQKGKFYVVDKTHASTKGMPDTFERADEFYSFKEINPSIHPLIKIDEKSYQGGKNGANHPMSWYHDFDGGRSFYINMGHTNETFSEPLMLNHIWEGLRYAIGSRPVSPSQGD